MKIYTLFMLLFCGITQSLSGQNWPQIGQTWDYSTDYWFVNRFQYTSDTMVSGVSYMKIQEYYKYIIGFAPGQTPGLSEALIGEAHLLRWQNDTLFRREYIYNLDVLEEDQIMICMNAQPGDSWKLSELIFGDTEDYDCDTSYVTVDSVGTMDINGNTLRWLAVHSNLPSTFGYNGKIVEGYGFINGSIFLNGMPCAPNFDYYRYFPDCYTSPQYGLLSIQNSTCNVFDAVGMKHIDSRGIQVYPTPANTSLNIQCENEPIRQIEFISTTGQMVKLQTNTSLSSAVFVDVSDIPTGIYFIRIFTDSRNYGQKVVVLH